MRGDEASIPDEPPKVGRRQALRKAAAGAAGVGVAWVAPAILTTEAAAAQSAPSPLTGTLSGVVDECLGQNPPGGDSLEVAATPSGGGVPVTTLADSITGEYQLTLAAGLWDVTITGISPPGLPDAPITVMIVQGATTFQSFQYQGYGC